jgi:hypothetical protein
MRMKMIPVAVLVVTFVCAAVAFGLSMEYPIGQPVPGWPDWPAGLKDLVNSGGRVLGYSHDADDFLYYRGDADRFNRFLAGCAKLKDAPVTLILHPGGGIAYWGGKPENKVSCDWGLSVLVPLQVEDPRTGRVLLYNPLGGPPLPERAGNPKYLLQVDLWLGGDVELKKLEVPASIEVKSGGEIEDFVAAHQKPEMPQGK